MLSIYRLSVKRVLLTAFIIMVTSISAGAYEYSYTFNNVPISDAIVRISKDHPEINISFIYKELDNYTVSAKINTDDVYDALHQIIGINPVSVIKKGDDYYVEAFQHGHYTIHGRVVDGDEEPMVAGVIYILSGDEVKPLTYGITDNDGAFRIPCDSNDVTLKISYLGYDDFSMKVPLSGNCGVISLSESPVKLQNVVVEGELPMTRIAGNAMITTIANTVLASAGTANDVLVGIPLVFGSDGNYSVFGRGSAVIYINNRIVTNPSALDQLSSSEIKSIEVISNPGAKYSAETNAVIRIVTLPPKGEGFSIALYNRLKVAHFALNTDNVSLKYRHGGLEIFANGYFHGGKRRFHDVPSMTTYGKSIFEQLINAYTINTIRNFSGKIGFNYQIGENHSFGGYFETGSMKAKPNGSIESVVTNDGKPYEKLSTIQSAVERTMPSHEANVYYSGKIGNSYVDFNADYVENNSKKDFTHFETDENDSERTVITDAGNRKRLLAEKLNVSYPLWNGQIEVGEEYTNSKVSYNSVYTGADISGSDTRINEDNISAFVELTQTFGKFQTGLGVRFEHVRYKYYEGNRLDEDRSRTYNNWFPSVFASTKIGRVGLSLNITSRTTRPSYYQLDGALQYINRYSYQSGDPSLKPVDIYSVQLMAQWSCFFAQAIYSYEKNPIFYTAHRYNDDPLVKLIKFENSKARHKYQFAIGAQPHVGCWSPQPTIGVYCSRYATRFLDREMKLNRPILIFNWDNAISLPHGWIIDADFMVQTSGSAENCYLKARSYLNFGVRKSFFDDMFSIQFNANDIFDTNNERIVMYNGDIKVTTVNYQESRNVMLTLRYNINTSRSKYKGTGAGQAEKNRM